MTKFLKAINERTGLTGNRVQASVTGVSLIAKTKRANEQMKTLIAQTIPPRLTTFEEACGFIGILF